MKILITGAYGFIGRNLAEKLAEYYTVEAPDRKELDLTKTKEVELYLCRHRFDVIIHAANINSTRKQATAYESLDGNLRMFFNLVRCSDLFGKMYYFGSGAEYDMRHYIPDMKEDYFGTHIPKDPYGFSKYIMYKTCESMENVCDLRLFGVYGKYEEWERRFISNAICRGLAGKDIRIQKNVYFDYLWIEDLCRIMIWFIQNKPEHKAYNVCRGRKKDLYSLAEIVRERLHADCRILVSESGWKPEYTGNNERLLKELGTFQFTGFEKSIDILCDYYKNSLSVSDLERMK